MIADEDEPARAIGLDEFKRTRLVRRATTRQVMLRARTRSSRVALFAV
jgi:hypothetical protein